MKNRIDTLDQNGLRGFISIWMVVFHALSMIENPIDIAGESLMAMFFLLSGYALTIAYYCNFIDSSAKKDSESSPLVEAPLEKVKKFSYSSFVLNRFLRIIPIFYVTAALSLPTMYAGFGTCDPNDNTQLIESYITNIIPSSTWFLGYVGIAFDYPGWTIQTLLGMWLMLPFIWEWLHPKSDSELLGWMCWCFWIQMFIIIFVYYVLGLYLDDAVTAYLSYLHPFSRVWCLMMGVIAGILSLRHRNEENMPWFEDAHWFFPLKSTFLFSWCNFEYVPKSFNSQDFLDLLFSQTWVIVVITVAAIGADTIQRFVYGGNGIGLGVWFQAIVPFCQTNIIVAMTRHKHEENLISRFLRTDFMQWLGDLSFCVYLIHFPIISFILWWRYGFQTLEWTDDGAYTQAFIVPDLLFLYLPVLAVVAGAIIHYSIEKPFTSFKISA